MTIWKPGQEFAWKRLNKLIMPSVVGISTNRRKELMMAKMLLVVVPILFLTGCATIAGTPTSADTRIKVVSQKDGTVGYIDRNKGAEIDQRPWWQKYPRFPGTHP